MSLLAWLIILKAIMWLIMAVSLIFLFFAAFSIYVNLTTGVPWAKIPQDNLYKIFREVNLPRGALIYDLGAGDGRVLAVAEKFGLKPVGFELSLYPYLKARLRNFFSKNKIIIKRQDFFKQNLSQADAVFMFLVGKVMTKVSLKLKTELRPRAVVISYGFALPGWQSPKVISTVPSLTYVYKAI